MPIETGFSLKGPELSAVPAEKQKGSSCDDAGAAGCFVCGFSYTSAFVRR